MKSNRLSPMKPSPAPATDASAAHWYSCWNTFWFSAVQPSGLHWLRVFGGILFLAWLIPFMGHQTEFFGLQGWADTQTYQEIRQFPGGAPVPLGWSLVFLCGNNAILLHVLWWSALAVFLLFTLGVATRITSVLTWIFVVSFVGNPATHFDADFLLIILAFYLMVGYLLFGLGSGGPITLNRLLGNVFLSPLNKVHNAAPSYAANLALRLFQVHFAIIVFTGCLHKLQFGDWWSGVAFWYPLHNPFAMNAQRLSAESQYAVSLLVVLGVAQYIVLAWQLAFPFFAWRPGWRWLLISGGVLAWIGSIFVFGEPLFGPFYLIGCLSYLTAKEWQALTNRLAISGVRFPAPGEKVALRR